MKIGLFFGSFNPVHIGHLALANYMVEFTDLQELWFVLSPQNPFKEKKTLLPDTARHEILHRALNYAPKFRISDIEFKLPKPSYTIDTLAHLYDKFPQHQFVLIMGGDGLPTFHRWKNYDQILANHEIYVYPRPGYMGSELEKHEKISIVDAPLIELSASFIRNSIKEGRDMRFFIPHGAYEYIYEMNFYKS